MSILAARRSAFQEQGHAANLRQAIRPGPRLVTGLNAPEASGITPISPRTALAVAVVAAAACSAGIWQVRSEFFIDDAAFFFRYAEHLAQGFGFRWNVTEDPMWGASAPLWPMLLAVCVRAGASPEWAAVVCGWVLTVTSTVLLALTALRCVGLSAAAWTILACATDWRYCSGAVQGMESPLAYALVGAGLFTLSGKGGWVAVGVIAGLSLAQKVDFAVFGVLLLVGAWIKGRSFPWRAVVAAGLIAGAWYGFALLHFGSVVPNSLVTKFHDNRPALGHTWFVSEAFLKCGRAVLLPGLVLGVAALWGRAALLVPALGLMAALSAVYTLKPPSETFDWYQAPVQPALCLVAGCGLGGAFAMFFQQRRVRPTARPAVQCGALLLVGLGALRLDREVRNDLLNYLDSTERDRTQAGRWIDAHVPADARLLTVFGNIAYSGRRFTYDSSNLNRRPPARTPEQLLEEYRPEVVAVCPFRTGVAPENWAALPGYRTVAVFDSARRRALDDFYVVVMVREGLPIRPDQPVAPLR